MPKDSESVEIPQLTAHFQYSGGSWTEFDIFSLLKPLEAFPKHWNSVSVQLLRYAYKSPSNCFIAFVCRLTETYDAIKFQDGSIHVVTLLSKISLSRFSWKFSSTWVGRIFLLVARRVLTCPCTELYILMIILQVCKRLFEISTARPLWTRLLHRLSAELMAPHLRKTNRYL
jgi:hypothetical protein